MFFFTCRKKKQVTTSDRNYKTVSLKFYLVNYHGNSRYLIGFKGEVN